MNNRIYPRELFDKEVHKIINQKYCPICYYENKKYLMNTIDNQDYQFKCQSCGEMVNLISKEKMRDLKIDRLSEK